MTKSDDRRAAPVRETHIRQTSYSTRAVLAGCLLLPTISVMAQVYTESELNNSNASVGEVGLAQPNQSNTRIYDDGLAPGDNDFRYISAPMFLAEGGTFDVGQYASPVDTTMFIYRDTFDPDNPAENFVAFNDDWQSVQFPEMAIDPDLIPEDAQCGAQDRYCPGFRVELEVGVQYQVVISTYRPEPPEELDFPQRFFVFGPGVAILGTPGAFADSASTRNQGAVAHSMDTLGATRFGEGSSDITRLLSRLYVLDATTTENLLQELTGEIHASALAVSRDSRRQLDGSIQDRLAEYRGRQATNPDNTAQASDIGAVNAWVRGLRASDELRPDATTEGYSRTGSGLLVGADTRLENQALVGVAMGMAENDVRGRRDGEAEVDTLHAAVYAMQPLGQAFVDGTISVGKVDYQTRRRAGLDDQGQAARARSDASALGLAAEVGVGYRLRGLGGVIEPRTMLRYDRLRRESFSERSDSATALKVERETFESTQAGLDLAARWSFRAPGALEVQPALSIGYARELGDARATSHHRINDSAFTVRSSDSERDRYRYTAGIRLLPTPHASLYVGYEGQLANGYRDDMARAAITLHW